MHAIGIDSLDIVRIQNFVDNERFLSKYFTEYEVAYCNQTINRTMRMAGLYCAKEAFVKALGIGIGGGIPLNEIEINHDKNGKPVYNCFLNDDRLMVENRQLVTALTFPSGLPDTDEIIMVVNGR
jgi:holo-[acyl-carrier-protein] synthase